jgi:ribosomal protein L44E
MKVQRDKDQVHVSLEGPIGDTTELFILPLKDMKQLTIDMTKTTYINSIGVKHWITWAMKLAPTLDVKLVNCPFVIVNQANIVVGFMTKKMKVESFRMPYVCEECSREETLTATRGKEYEYASPGVPKKIEIPSELPCPKCQKGKLEPDFFREKTFKFLDQF